ncbi:MAG: ECF transporter S component [Erysipelotrichaceae bacterium]|nr:ECF transporter S component [Erysipelotrichaceae bacterium]
MKIELIKSNLSQVQKITLAGILISLIIILQKVLAINYIPVVPFLRISLGGCALLIFASIFLGPWYGLLIGIAEDLLGYLIFDPKSMSFFPQITAIYGLMGFVSYFVFMLIRQIKNKKVMFIVEMLSFAAVLTAVTLFITLNNEITLYSSTYTIEIWQKIAIPLILFALLAALTICIIFTERYFKKRKDSQLFNAYQVSFACFIIELFVMILFGTLMKGFAFGFQTYPVILITQLMVGFINIPLNTFLISYIMIFAKRKYNVQD